MLYIQVLCIYHVLCVYRYFMNYYPNLCDQVAIILLCIMILKNRKKKRAQLRNSRIPRDIHYGPGVMFSCRWDWSTILVT